jgi:exodeoxyribonuclease V alpha subunit
MEDNMNVKGEVRRIFYKTEKGFMVGIVKVKNTDDEELKIYLNKTITFSGNFHELNEDFDYIFYGEVVDHPKYGMQFKVDNYKKLMPEDKNAIIAFLSSGLFPKVGIRTSTKIVETLGEKTLELILEAYENLLMVPNMTEKRAKEIYRILDKEQMSYKVILYLQEIGFSFNQSNNIYKYYKNETSQKLEEDIYNVVENIEGIGFNLVDKIAMLQGMKKDDERRIYAGILFSIYDLCFEFGSTYCLIEDIYLKVVDYLNINMDIKSLENYLFSLFKKGKLVIEKDKYYLKKIYDIELNVALRVSELVKKSKEDIKNIGSYISTLENLFSIKYNESQKESVKLSLENNFTIITGGPGTGKTTIVKAIVESYRNINKLNNDGLLKDLVLLAPTGRAAKRIKEATGFPASTIHKFLRWNKETNEFGVNIDNKSDVKFVIVDEISMIDIFLFNNLLDGLDNNIKIVLVGDYNQLPSVLPGQVLKDLIDSNVIPMIELKELYRQKEDSYIINLSTEIKDGVISKNAFIKKSDYSFIECNKNTIEKLIIDVCKKAIEKKYSYKDLQILVPMYKGINGIDNLNKELQSVFNPRSKDKNEIEYGGVIYREQDKVLQIKNVSDYDVSNGDIGIIDYIGDEKDNNKIVIDFDGELVEYNKSDLENVRLGYAISIHKAQGSEFDIVIIPMDLSFSRMLYRKLIYTAVTRAKKSLTLIGEKEAFINSVSNQKEDNRMTTLKDNIIRYL